MPAKRAKLLIVGARRRPQIGQFHPIWIRRVEQIIRNDGVTGSNPVSGTTPFLQKIMKISRKALPLRKAIWCDLWHFRLRFGADPAQTQLVDRNIFGSLFKIKQLKVSRGWSLVADWARKL